MSNKDDSISNKDALIALLYNEFPKLQNKEYQSWFSFELDQIEEGEAWINKQNFPVSIKKLLSSLLLKKITQDCGKKTEKFFYS